jgi:Family of unknown function (DUF6882)
MSADTSDPASFIQGALEGLRLQTSGHSGIWRLGKEQNWAADLDTGTLTFSFADGATATAPIQVVGTYNTLEETFLWGWDHPSVPGELRRHAQLAREWGEKNNLEKFMTRKVSCSEEECWEFTAVTVRLANANGAYRGPAGSTLVFMTFGSVRVSNP